MNTRSRLYDTLLAEHLATQRQMAFISGPRQVGKTTTCRNKDKREVDFLVARDGQPWFLAEVKQHDELVSSTLKHFQQQLAAPFAFQVILDADYIDADCFARPGAPGVVPARTFLAQLL